MSAELTYRDGVAILTLNRPKALNALNAEMIGEISTVWTRSRYRTPGRCSSSVAAVARLSVLARM